MSKETMRPIAEEAKDKIIVALDTQSLDEAIAAVQELSGYVGAFKVGLELLTAEGSKVVVQSIHSLGCRIFYDGKFNDIPNTVGGAAKSAAKLGVWMFDVHASSGPDAVAEAVKNQGDSLIVAVTVLTSLDEVESENIFGSSAKTKVIEFARLAAKAGADGVVCSPQELTALKADPTLRSLITVVPGIRPAWAIAGDQARVMTPGEAIRAGASYVVIGRPILRPPSAIGRPAEAAMLIAKEIQESLNTRV